MDWLNYHHLYYFSVIAAEGGVAAAARKLRLTHSTLSTQLGNLEDHFGTPLFERRGKRLVLTPFGVEAASYASDIFRLGSELNDVGRGRASPRSEVLRIGVVAGIPKTLVHYLLAPMLDQLGTGTAVVRQDVAPQLIESLAGGRLHVVLTNDVPTMTPGMRFHAHSLGETDVLLYARANIARKLARGFPGSLAGAPFVLPPSGAPLRRSLDAWLSEQKLDVNVRAELDDAGLLRVFGSAGRGVFPVRAVLAAEVEDLRDVRLVGRCVGVSEHYYAITSERRITHSALSALVDAARAELNAPALRKKRPKRRR